MKKRYGIVESQTLGARKLSNFEGEGKSICTLAWRERERQKNFQKKSNIEEEFLGERTERGDFEEAHYLIRLQHSRRCR